MPTTFGGEPEKKHTNKLGKSTYWCVY
ncbi:hypothetical protein [Staphylococcus aureus]